MGAGEELWLRKRVENRALESSERLGEAGVQRRRLDAKQVCATAGEAWFFIGWEGTDDDEGHLQNFHKLGQ